VPRVERLAANKGESEAAVAAAVEQVAELVKTARRPLITGLVGLGVEDCRAVLDFAQRRGIAVAPHVSPLVAAVAAAETEVGAAECSFGEILTRADVVAFLHVDPATSHPRLGERLLGPRPDFQRQVWMFGEEPPPASKASSNGAEKSVRFMPIPPGGSYAWLTALRATLRGVGHALDGSLEDGLADFATALKRRRYGVLFFGLPPEADSASYAARWVEQLFRLIHELDTGPPMRALPLVANERLGAAAEVVGWRYGPDGAALRGPVLRATQRSAALAEADLIIHCGRWTVPMETVSGGRAAPLVYLGPQADVANAAEPALHFDCAQAGVDAGDTVFRGDGVALAAKPLLPTGRRPTLRDALAAVEQAARQD